MVELHACSSPCQSSVFAVRPSRSQPSMPALVHAKTYACSTDACRTTKHISIACSKGELYRKADRSASAHANIGSPIGPAHRRRGACAGNDDGKAAWFAIRAIHLAADRAM